MQNGNPDNQITVHEIKILYKKKQNEAVLLAVNKASADTTCLIKFVSDTLKCI